MERPPPCVNLALVGFPELADIAIDVLVHGLDEDATTYQAIYGMGGRSHTSTYFEISERHSVWTTVTILGKTYALVGVDPRRNGKRRAAAQDLVDQLDDYVVANYRALDSKRRRLKSAAPKAKATPETCEVTTPNGSTPPGETPQPSFHGNGALWTQLWPDGAIRFVPVSSQREVPPGSIPHFLISPQTGVGKSPRPPAE